MSWNKGEASNVKIFADQRIGHFSLWFQFRVQAGVHKAKLPSSLTRARPSEIERTRFAWIQPRPQGFSLKKPWGRGCLIKLIITSTNINHKGLQRNTNEYAKERRIYRDLISKNNNVDMLNSASKILQCWSYYVKMGVYINAKFAINSHCSCKKNLAIKSLCIFYKPRI